MEETRAFLKSIGMPEGDLYNLPTSEKRFCDGGQYRFEVPGIQGPKVMEVLLETMDKYGIWLHRVTQTKGIMMLTDNEIMEWCVWQKRPGLILSFLLDQGRRPIQVLQSIRRKASAWDTGFGGRNRLSVQSKM